VLIVCEALGPMPDQLNAIFPAHAIQGDANDLEQHLSTFITPYLTRTSIGCNPQTVLTWAQSLDAKIAPSSTSRYPLSCWEAWCLAHMIRRKSDAILIGAQTAVTDNPSLIGDLPHAFDMV